jgi:hypothetical protein
MESIDWLALTRIKMSRVLSIAALVVFAFACSDGSEDVTPSADASARKNGLNANVNTPNGNCESKKEDYTIVVENPGDGTPEDGSPCWKYTITLAPGAKAISHFILDLDNCPAPYTGVAFENIISSKVNGEDWPVSSSEGEGTGCDVTSSRIVKFDNLPDAQVYVLEFCLNQGFHNYLDTSVWIKAGCICHKWEEIIDGPCCAF